jgi:monoamine oxidase
LAYDSPFWKNPSGGGRGNLGNYTGEFVSQKFWDSSRGQGGQKALITFMRAGSDAAKMGAGGTDEAIADLKIFNKDSGERNLLASELANWKLRKGFEGSMIAYKPGQYTRFRGVAVEPEYSGKFLFAGEHTSLRFAGTLQGALESGYQAAADIAEKMS